MTEKKEENSRFWSTHFFENTIFRWYTFGKSYTVKFNYFSVRPNKVKESFKLILIDHYAGDIGNKNIAGK